MAEMKKNLKIRKGLIVSGVFMILAGILACVYPDTTLLATALYLGLMFLISGGGYLVDFYWLRSGWLLAVGLLNIIVGAVLILNLGITAASLPALLAIWILSIAVVQIAVGVDAKSAKDPAWKWLLLSGFLGVLFGLWILGAPTLGVFAVSTLVGFYLFLYGGLSIAEYIEMKKMKHANG